MTQQEPMRPAEFGAVFKSFLEHSVADAPEPVSELRERLLGHMEKEPEQLEVVSESVAGHDHPNFQVALDSWLAADEHEHELIGVQGNAIGIGMISLPQILARPRSGLVGMPTPEVGPVDRVNVEVGERVLACVRNGLFLVRDGATPLALLVHAGHRAMMGQAGIEIDVLARSAPEAQEFLATLRKAMQSHNVYRGRILSLSATQHGALEIAVHALPQVERQSIILPDGLLARLERATLGIAQHSEVLRAAGRHLRRGVLLYGHPGTGKTLTAMHLAGRMTGRTVLLLTGRGLGLIGQSVAMARALQPSTVVLEDVDLVARERTSEGVPLPLLFELLNEMDGLSDDADVLFLLTTNRADLLEPALAARPGRIDLALELPLPDEGCRWRLMQRYAVGLTLAVSSLDPYIQRTDGVSAAFIRELLRRAAAFAADDAPRGPLVVTDKHLDDALFELLVAGGELTRSLLGVRGGRGG